MRTTELIYVERRIQEELTARAAGQGSYFKYEEVEVASCQSR
ncbi:hypothetical protein [Paraburkholderia ginsengiterrae]|nr:hypothetical protein [Paraburkholderia ginsengiterrae]